MPRRMPSPVPTAGAVKARYTIPRPGFGLRHEFVSIAPTLEPFINVGYDNRRDVGRLGPRTCGMERPA